MTISKSVGRNGVNSKVDVKVIQAALNLLKINNFVLENKLIVDGIIGKKTISAIDTFQKNIVALNTPDGRIDPTGKTLALLKKYFSKGLSEDALMAIMTLGQASTIKKYLPFFKDALPKYKINTPLRITHLLAQIGHESKSLLYTEELASGAAYENRKDLGNINHGDGVRFKGRGLLQITGRDNYANYGKYIGIDLLKKGNENIISKNPKYALDVSLWFWDSRHLNRYADNDNLNGITRRINGGLNGLHDRQNYLNRARFFLI